MELTQRKKLVIFIIILTGSSSLIIPNVSAAEIEVLCVVSEEASGTPVEGAKVQVLRRRSRYYTSRRWQTVDSGISDEKGLVVLSLDDDQRYLFVTSNDKSETTGYDYVPHVKYFSVGEEPLEIKLSKGATLKVAGQGHLIETINTPETSYTAVDPITGHEIQDSVGFRYGSEEFSINYFIGIQDDIIVVPIRTPIYLQVRSEVEIEGKEFSYNFIIKDFQENQLEQGETQNIDLREYTIESSISKSREFSENITRIINEEEEAGFFLAIEKLRLSSAQDLIDEAEEYYVQESFEIAYTRLREAYVELSDINSSVVGMVAEALRSVYLLIVFFVLSSTIVGFVLFDDFFRKIFISLMLYVTLLAVLQFLHPGNQHVSRIDYISISGLVFFGVQIVCYLFPKLLQTSAPYERVSMINIVVPVLSIAKRNLRRRGLRFGLTLMTLLLLVASFISLTSFTSGYGLSIEKTSSELLKPSSIIVRSSNPPPKQALATFSGGDGVFGPSPLDEELLSWFYSRLDSIVIAPKYESHASKQYREFYLPVAYVDRVPLFGVMSIIPSEEVRINDIESTIVKGRYLADDDLNSVMISLQLSEELQVFVGDSIWFEMYGRELWLDIIGILDDNRLENLGDVDGGSILPYKIIEVGRTPLDGPDIVTEGLTTCDASETIIINMETANQLNGLWLARINVMIDDDSGVIEHAKMIALSKGQHVWASVTDGVYSIMLASYFEGKGLPVVVPWIIVILNVIVTMLNSYYERRKEVMIYSSVGMNPSHVSLVFLGEAAVLGLIGGSIGYILGLGAYKLIYILTPALQVKQKISAIWSLGAIGISLTAVLIGGLVSQRTSTALTPSLKRKWQVDIDKTQGYTELDLPLKIPLHELDDFYRFVLDRLVLESNNVYYLTKRIIERRDESSEMKKVIDFVYCSADIKFGGVYTRNKLIIEKMGDVYVTLLRTRGNPVDLQLVGSFFRKIGIEYSLAKSNQYEKG